MGQISIFPKIMSLIRRFSSERPAAIKLQLSEPPFQGHLGQFPYFPKILNLQLFNSKTIALLRRTASKACSSAPASYPRRLPLMHTSHCIDFALALLCFMACANFSPPPLRPLELQCSALTKVIAFGLKSCEFKLEQETTGPADRILTAAG